MGVNLFQYKTLHTTQSIDNQLLKHTSCHFDLQKNGSLFSVIIPCSAEKHVKSDFVHT